MIKIYSRRQPSIRQSCSFGGTQPIARSVLSNAGTPFLGTNRASAQTPDGLRSNNSVIKRGDGRGFGHKEIQARIAQHDCRRSCHRGDWSRYRHRRHFCGPDRDANPAARSLNITKGVSVQPAFGSDDEDCMYATREVVMPGGHLQVMRRIECAE
jgi:hypothetical protein